MKIIWSPFAIERVTEFAEFIAQESQQNSIMFVEGIFQEVERLKKFPKLGRQLMDFRNREIREIPWETFRIVYRIEQDRIILLTVRHSRQVLWEKNEL
jgi:plasmid stabilization system protein ParE